MRKKINTKESIANMSLSELATELSEDDGDELLIFLKTIDTSVLRPSNGKEIKVINNGNSEDKLIDVKIPTLEEFESLL